LYDVTILIYSVSFFILFLPASPKAEAGLGIAFSVCLSQQGSTYLVYSVIQTVFNQYYSNFAQCLYTYWRCAPPIMGWFEDIFSYIFCMLNLVIFYHYMSWTVPSWCNLKLQQCSINIIQTLRSVCIHIEDVHLLLWADLTICFL
jgi:hypothetical protein